MNKIAFAHDYHGSCDPNKRHGFSMNTFSVGIFQWIPKSSGKGLKRSLVKYRVKGYSSNPQAVYDRAAELCMRFDQAYAIDPNFKMRKKSETV